ncbi:MAG: hypothetical protein H7Y04_13515, partial [Verrucomicrobia bacterium]|nr:hypothetical protein [Cytophagales bacterium]
MKLIKQLAILSIILFAVFWVLDVLFTEVFKSGDYNKVQWVNQIENQTFDYLVHGNSRVYTTMDVGKLNQETGLKGFNVSVDGSSIVDQALMLEMFLAKGNTFKKLFLQIDPWSLDNDSIVPFALPKFFPYLKQDLVFRHYSEFGFQWYAYRYIPFYRYAEFNSIWGPHQVANDLFKLLPKEYDQNGGHFYTDTTYRGKRDLEKMEYKVMGGKLKYFSRIVATCRKNNIELITFTSPIANACLDSAHAKSMQALQQTMAARNITYHNFSDIFNQKYEYFTDEIHLNQFGVAAYHPIVKNMLTQSFQTDTTAI